MISQDQISKFRDDLETVMCKYSIEFPFWGVLSERCKFSLVSEGVPTAGMTADGHCMFNINFIEELRTKHKDNFHKKLLFLTAHEISHFVFEHGSRQEDRDQMMFNCAADYAINLLLHYQFKNDKDYFIEGGLLDEQYQGETAESIYEKLMQDPNNQSRKHKKVRIDIVAEGDEPDEGEGGEGGEVTVRDRRVPMPSKEGKSDKQSQSEMSDHIVRALSEAFAVAKSQGKLPADFERAISKILKPKVDWLRALRQKMRFGMSKLEKRDVDWLSPNRRFLGKDYILPSQIGPSSPKIAYAVDTSGSMSQRDLEQAMSELEEIRKRFNAKVYGLDCDADAHSSDWLHPQQPLPVLNGGGGTDFAPVFDHLGKKRIKPDYCIFFTDGYGNFGNEPPNYPVLWIMTSDVKPPFGDTIQVNVPYEE